MMPEDIEKSRPPACIQSIQKKRRAAEKLHDLHVLYQQMEQHLQDEYVHSEDYLTLLAQQIPLSEELRGHTFI